jgi:DNA-binding NarL/FixJ family response regulator
MPRPANALIVDDEPHVVVLLRALLKELGVGTVWDAADGPAALALAAAHSPEVVLLDLNLPQVDGLDVLAKLKAEHPKMPVIVVSAQSTLKTFSRARELGAEAYVLKYRAKSDVRNQISEAFDRIGGGRGDGPAPGAKKPAGPARAARATARRSTESLQAAHESRRLWPVAPDK